MTPYQLSYILNTDIQTGVKMKKILLTALLSFMILSCGQTKQVQQTAGEQLAERNLDIAVGLAFTFTRQSGPASNQYAIWIENSEGKLVKSLYASRWTANGGYSRRPTSIPLWIKQSNRPGMTQAQVDAVSGATPGTGDVAYIWDGTDNLGQVVPAGDYTLILEGTLRWENQVYYRTPVSIELNSDLSAIDQIVTGQTIVEYAGDGARAERAMISDVHVGVLIISQDEE